MSGLYVSICNQHGCEEQVQTARKFDSLIEHLLCIPNRECSQLEEILYHVELSFNEWIRETCEIFETAYKSSSNRYRGQDGFFEDFISLHDISQLNCIERVFMALLPLFNEAYYPFTIAEKIIRLSPDIVAKAKDLRSRDIFARRKAYNYILPALYFLEKYCREILTGLQTAKPIHAELYKMLDVSQISFIYEVYDIELGASPNKDSAELLAKDRLNIFVDKTKDFLKKHTVNLIPILTAEQRRCTTHDPNMDMQARIIGMCLGVYYLSLSYHEDGFNIEYFEYLKLCAKYYLLTRNIHAHLNRKYIDNTIDMMLGVSNAERNVLWTRVEQQNEQTPIKTLVTSEPEEDDAQIQRSYSPSLFM